jgi:hypothetical protein
LVEKFGIKGENSFKEGKMYAVVELWESAPKFNHHGF